MSWNPSYANSTLERIAEELNLRLLDIKDHKFVLKDGHPINPVPISVEPIPIQLWNLWVEGNLSYQIENIQDEVPKDAKYAVFSYVHHTEYDAYFTMSLFK